jgi:hypothetical protein
MAFKLGDTYEFGEGRRFAIVTQIHSDGRAGLMHFADTEVEEWLLWDELRQEGKWCQR